jgi:hypothetical protein
MRGAAHFHRPSAAEDIKNVPNVNHHPTRLETLDWSNLCLMAAFAVVRAFRWPLAINISLSNDLQDSKLGNGEQQSGYTTLPR